MKSNTKSSITLPPSELAIVNNLLHKLNAKSKVDVIRRGLKLLQEQYEADLLRNQFQNAVKLLKNSTKKDLQEIDPLAGENL